MKLPNIFKFIIIGILAFVLTNKHSSAQENNSQVVDQIDRLIAEHTNIDKIVFAQTPGHNDVQVIKIGKFNAGEPAIFIAANMPGNEPLNTKGAIWLANYIATNKPYNEKFNWYILPCGNPDAYARSFSSLKWDTPTNHTSVNDDNDELIDEDGPEDLNHDGLITQMLVKHPLGEYIKDTADCRVIRKADPLKGEKGIYKLYTEGVDNDHDGQYNEDPEGGVNINHNFPYQFKSFVPENGKWNGSEAESFSMMKFFADHPEIALVVVLGETNNLLFPPDKDKKGNETKKIKVPDYFAGRLGIDASKMYSVDELKEEVAQNVEDQEMGKRILKMLLNTTPPTDIEDDDIEYYQQISKEYKEFLKANGQPILVEKAKDWDNGSFEQFVYFQYGLPLFSINLWQIPAKSPDDKKDKKSDKTKLEKFLAYADSSKLDVFVNWEKVDHPDFKEVEIGGLKPYAMFSPANDSLEGLFKRQLPFIANLSQKLPVFTIEAQKEIKGKSLIQIDIYVSNNGQLPYPTAMGERTGATAPVILLMKGDAELLSGKNRTTVGQLNANETKKYTFLINKKKSANVVFELETKNVFTNQSPLTIEL